MLPKKSAEETELDQEEATLRAEAESIDPARPEDASIPDEKSEAEERAAALGETSPSKRQRPGGDKKPDATAANKAETTTAKAETTQKPDATAKEKQTQSKTGENAATNPSQYQRERERLNDSWTKVNKTKSELDKREQEMAKRERALAEQEQRSSTITKAKATDARGLSADDYEAVAKDYEAEGKVQLAAKCRDQAKTLREQEKAEGAGGQRTERFTASELQKMTAEWQANLEQVGKDNPELTQEGSPLRARVAELLKTKPLLHMSGDGILYAVELAKTEAKAKRADELEAKNAELEKEVKRLTALTSLPSGGAQPAAQAKKFDELSLDEQEATLREEAAAN